MSPEAAGSAEPFVGRMTELSALTEAYGRASSGCAGIMFVVGPAGIGKTALVRAFLAAAAPAVVISASGDEAEAALPWGVLSQLASGAPAGQRESLAQLAELTAEADSVAVGHLLSQALAGLSSDGVTVIVAEDLHWIDHPSAVALRFALRRLTHERILVVATMRPEKAALDDGWRRLLDRGAQLRLTGLALPEITRLAGVLGMQPLPWPAAHRLWRHTCGNPLYVRWLIEEVDPEVLAAATGPLPAPRRLATSLAARVAACTPGTQDFVAAAAVLGDLCRLVQVVSLAGVRSPADALAEAETAGLLTESRHRGIRQVGFQDPVTRAAIYHSLGAVQRAALHSAAARLCAGAAALSHRVAAATGPDAALATELAQVAGAEVAAGRHALAAGNLMNAADLSAEPALREDRLLAAFTLWLRSGQVHEVGSRRDLLEAMTPGPRRDYLRGSLAYLEGRHDEARRAWRAALDQLRAAVPLNVLAAEATACQAGLALFDWDWQTALAMAAPRSGPGVELSLMIRCIALAMAGRPADAGQLLAAARWKAAPGRDSVLGVLARGFVKAWSDDLGGAKSDLEGIAGRPADFGGSLRPVAQWLLADVYYRMGALDHAMATAELALSMLRDTGRAQGPEVVAAHALAAYVTSVRGNWADARNHVLAAQHATGPTASKLERAWAASASWPLAEALDDPAEMLKAACALKETADAPELSVFPFGPVMAEALWRNRRYEDAAVHLSDYERRAQQLGRASAIVGASRIRGLLEASRHDSRAALRAFEAAAPVAERLSQPLEVARFLAAHGAVLASLGRRTAATSKIAHARRIFEQIDAQPYLRRADEQIERLGYGSGRRAGISTLTASESVVARLVASGLSNKQTAEKLMVSVKAIEFHLANIYLKLGVSSRSQLAARRDSLLTARTANP